MFIKVNEFSFPLNEKTGTEMFCKKYSYSPEYGANDIVRMMDESIIDRIVVAVDDEYPYGAGEYSVNGFLNIYNEIFPLDTVYIYGRGLGCEISIYDKKHLISLFFENAKEMPTTEITDIIQGKKEDEEEVKNDKQRIY